MMCCISEQSQAEYIALSLPEGVPSSIVGLISILLKSSEWERIDAIEDDLSKLEQIHFPLNHIFTKTPGVTGLYTREIYMPAGTIATSRIHLCQSPFVISKGRVSVWCEGKWQTMEAPYTGVTEPGSRRLIYVHADTIWSAFFVTDKIDPDEIGMEVTFTGGKFKELGIAAAQPSLT